MDSRTLQTQQGAADEAKRKELETLALIKTAMPETYASIQKKAQQSGNAVFTLVRFGCAHVCIIAEPAKAEG